MLTLDLNIDIILSYNKLLSISDNLGPMEMVSAFLNGEYIRLISLPLCK